MRRIGIPFFFVLVFGAVLAVLIVPVVADSTRICFGAGSVRAAVFMLSDRIEVYTIDAQDRGELQLSFTQTYLVTLPGRPSQDLLLGASDVNIHVEMWRTTGGLYRVVAGPDGENKMHECIFGGGEARVRTYTYAGETLAESDSVDDAPPTGAATPANPGVPGDPTSAVPTDVPNQPTDAPAEPTTQPDPPTPVGTEELRFGG